ncbi:MAG: hypothetical protein WBB39_04800 [Candidatus Saccharimonadales bacterium]
MELIKSAARRSQVSDIVYILLNMGFVLTVYLLARFFDPPSFAYAVVILSKWRTLAVRPRFWFANIQTNLVDLMFGLSIVTLIWQANGHGWLQVAASLVFGVWLLVIKPQSKRQFVILQAGLSQFVALASMLSFAYVFDSFFSVLSGFVIGYIAARHVLLGYEEEQTTLLSLGWGMIVAELMWVAYHWTIVYHVVTNNNAVGVGSGNVAIPQMAVVIALLSYLSANAYDNYHRRKLTIRIMRRPIIFVIAVLIVLFEGEFAALFHIL